MIGDPGAAEITIDEILGWNGYPELICQWLPAVMSGALKPAVATSWHYIGTGNRNFEITLRHNVRFSDGTP